MRIGYLITAIVVGLALILALQYRDVWSAQWWPFQEEPPVIEPVVAVVEPQEPSVAQLVQPLPVSVQPDPEPQPPLPGLSESDDYMRGLLSVFEAPEDWLSQTELARRLAVVLSSSAAGTLPRRQLGFLLPRVAFPVQPVGDDGKAFILDPAGYQRFEPVVNTLTGVSPEVLARIFTATEPLLNSAVTELGEQREVRTLLNQALNQVLRTPVLDQSIVLKRPEAVYQFADPALEGMSDLQKQLLRMGPAAVQRIQAYAQQVVEALNVTPAVPADVAAPSEEPPAPEQQSAAPEPLS